MLFLVSGQIVQAVCGALEGEEAVYEIVGWSSGQFSFADGVRPDSTSIHTNWEHLIMEGVRRRDEKTGAEAAVAAASVDPNASQQSIGPYQLRRKIGVGDHTEVFEAMQVSMDRVVALKVLAAEYQQDEAAVQNVSRAGQRQGERAASVYPGRSYEAGQHEGVYYYTREYVDGSNLADLRALGRNIDDPTALQCIKIAAEALSFLNPTENLAPAADAGGRVPRA